MLEQRKDALGNPPYWVCTKCNWAFHILQEATKHQCGTEKKATPAYVSYSRKRNGNQP
jgi:hypothetical protein